MRASLVAFVCAFPLSAGAADCWLGIGTEGAVASLQINGEAGQTYTIQFSDNLTHWTDLVSIPIIRTPCSWQDWAPKDVTRRFYRLEQEATGAAEPEYKAFGNPQPVTVLGYTDELMEPFMTRDGRYLLFNNRNSPPEQTDLHVSERIDDVTFQYLGTLGVNSPASLDGVATVDEAGHLYFVSTRSYFETLSTIYGGSFNSGGATGEVLVPNISPLTLGWLQFDVEVGADGQTLYLSEGQFSVNPYPDSADFVLAQKGGDGFARSPASAGVFQNINTPALEYAGCISADGLEFFFTRVDPGADPAVVGIYRAARSKTDAPFERPQRVSAISGGFYEAPALSPDGRVLYYHRNQDDFHVLECVTRFE